MEKKYFYSKDKLKLCGIWSIPKKKTVKAIILAHGVTVDKEEDGVFTELAKVLKNCGFAVFRFDFRGHGESAGKSIGMTIKDELNDLDSAINHVKSQGFSRIGLVAASFGGGIASLYCVNENSIKALCLWNPCLNYDHCFLNPYLPWIVKRKGHMKKDLQEKGWTTLGSRKFVLGKPLFEEMAKLYPYEEMRKIKIPTVVIHGDKDTYVPYEDSKDAVKNLKNATLITIKGAEHGFHEEEEMEKANKETLKFFLKYL